jgi:hypothetical protein
MSMEVFSDDCPGCRPAVVDVETGKVLAKDSPIMQTVLAVWATTTREERVAYHRVCCGNSRNQVDLRVFQGIATRMQTALTADDPTKAH